MMRSRYTMAAMAILASCYTATTTTYAFAPAATSSLQKHSMSSTIAPSSLHAFSDNHMEGDEEISFASAVASGWQPERGSFAGITRRNTKTSSTALGMSDYDSYAVIPDGGLSPCVIKVVGVGGGGCNAVSITKYVLVWHFVSELVFLILLFLTKSNVVHDMQTILK